MESNEFYKILTEKMNEPYMLNFSKTIYRNHSDKNVDDLIMDCYIYFVDNDFEKLNKIRNKNGARISIENWCRGIHRKVNKTYLKRVDNIRVVLTEKEDRILTKLKYNDLQKRLYVFFTVKNKKPKTLGIEDIVCKNKDGQIKCDYRKKRLELLKIINYTISESEGCHSFYFSEYQMELIRYLNSEKNRLSNYDLSPYRAKDNRKRLCKPTVVRELTKIYDIIMKELVGDK